MEPQPKQITVKVTRAFMLSGKVVKLGTIATYDRAFAAELITNQKAVAHNGNPAAETETETETKPRRPASSK